MRNDRTESCTLKSTSMEPMSLTLKGEAPELSSAEVDMSSWGLVWRVGDEPIALRSVNTRMASDGSSSCSARTASSSKLRTQKKKKRNVWEEGENSM